MVFVMKKNAACFVSLLIFCCYSFYRADPNTGNILNFNVGDNVDLAVPRVSN